MGYWYDNSLKALRATLLKSRKADERRLATLQKMGHPVAGDQERVIAFRERIVGLIDAELAIPSPADGTRNGRDT